MSLADHVSKREQCKTCPWYRQLPASERDFFDQHLASGGSRRALHRAVMAEGLDVVRSAFEEHLANHHRGGGDCGPS